jgi:hypothetical protein
MPDPKEKRRYLLWHPESECLWEEDMTELELAELLLREQLVSDVTNISEFETRYIDKKRGIERRTLTDKEKQDLNRLLPQMRKIEMGKRGKK